MNFNSTIKFLIIPDPLAENEHFFAACILNLEFSHDASAASNELAPIAAVFCSTPDKAKKN